MSKLNWKRAKTFDSYEEIDTTASLYRSYKQKIKAKKIKPKKKTVKDLQALIDKRDENF